MAVHVVSLAVLWSLHLLMAGEAVPAPVFPVHPPLGPGLYHPVAPVAAVHPPAPQRKQDFRLACQGGTGKNGIGLTIDDPSAAFSQGGYGSLGYGHLFSKEQKLNATLQVRTDLKLREAVTVIITDKGFVDPHGCMIQDFGSGLSSRGVKGIHGGHGFGYGNGYGGFGGGYGGGGFGGSYGGGYGGDFGGLGLAAAATAAYSGGGFGYGGDLGFLGGAVSPYGFSPHPFGLKGPLHHPHAVHGIHGQVDSPGDGAIASFKLGKDTLETFRLDSIGDFKKLADLAGRGVILCTETDKGYGGKAQCTGIIIACCALAFDDNFRGVPGGYGRG